MPQRLLSLLLALCAAPALAQAIVINEVHFNPPYNPVRQEFIELYNPGNDPVPLDGWRISGAVDYDFPAGTEIAGDGYLVIAEDPATLLATLSANALGPYAGSLNSDGETIRLRDAADVIVDEVDYKVGFPWPVASNGDGASMELINPALDNSLGSSWRASFPSSVLSEATLVPFADSGWSWRPGDSEASDPLGAWRGLGFVEDGTWTQNIQLPIVDPTVNGLVPNTTISTASYDTIFLRKEFTVVAGEIPAELRLRYSLDDGVIIWINGVEVERQRMAAGEPAFDDIATDGAPEGSTGNPVVEEKTVANPGSFLVEGSNLIAVQVFNESTGSGDLGFDLELYRPAQDPVAAQPSPGARNSAYASNAAPNIRKVEHAPKQPTSADPVVITAKVTDPQSIHDVSLEYQVVGAGDYIPSTLPHAPPNMPVDDPLAVNPAYGDPANWTTLTMADDGTNGDAIANDDIWSVTLPTQAHRTLVRYRIIVTDGLDLAARVPYADDPKLNFAYFVYDGVPDYNGHPAASLTSLPVYHLITRGEDYAECFAYNGGDQIPKGNQSRYVYNWAGTLIYDGEIYDHIHYRTRGGNGRYHHAGKRSMRFRLNDGDYFQARRQNGSKYPKKWRTLTTGKGFDNKSTLTWSLNEALSLYLFNQVGVPGSDTHWVHWRVIDGADEAPDQWRGDFHGLNFVIETYDVRMMEAHGMEKGNLYKLIDGTNSPERQARYQYAFGPTNGADHNGIENELNGTRPADYIANRVNMEKWNAWHAIVEAVRHYDFWPSANKNMVYYFEPDYLPGSGGNDNRGKLWILPWDTDASWGPSWNSGQDAVYEAVYGSGGASLRPEYYNMVREVRDLLWQPDQIEPLIDAFASVVLPMESADADRWKGAPGDAGNYNGLGGAGATSMEALVQDMKNFAFTSWSGGSGPSVPGPNGRGGHLDSLQASGGEGGQIPNTPTITYTGDDGFPTNALSFESTAFSDPQGSGSFGAMEWRIAEVNPPGSVGGQLVQFFDTGSSWSYLDDGSDQGTAWREPGFDDSGWVTGASPLGYADNQVVTLMDFGGDPGDKHITYYFRKKLTIDDPEAFRELKLTLQRDDGAVIYVNGSEVARSQMPAGVIDSETLASGGLDEDGLYDFTIPISSWAAGENVIAVEIHQISAVNSDMIFDLKMNGITGSTGADSVFLEWNASWESGELTTFNSSIAPPTVAVRSTSTYRARVRHQDNTGRWSHWSAPVEFTTSLPDISDYLSSLVISELMYHPTDPTAAELAAGFDDDDYFEYIEVYNAGDEVLDLRDLRFTKGVDFDFLNAAITSIAPGEFVLIVKNLAAFELRYGAGLPVAGEWDPTDKLDNGGETVKLSFGAGDAVREFLYDDLAPWPTAPDGSGFALALLDPASVPDHSLAVSWAGGSVVGGTPGSGELEQSYAIWRDAIFGPGSPPGSGELEDWDLDGLANFIEYALGSDPLQGSSASRPVPVVVASGPSEFLALRYTRRIDRPDVTIRVEFSTNLALWNSGPGLTIETSVIDNGDGTETIIVASLTPISNDSPQYLRLVVEGAP